jgi:hypothetical protein
MSITVIYHAISLTVLYQYHITMKSDMSITVIYHAISLTVLYQYHITMKSDMSITVIYHAMSLTVLYLCVSILVGTLMALTPINHGLSLVLCIDYPLELPPLWL